MYLILEVWRLLLEIKNHQKVDTLIHLVCQNLVANSPEYLIIISLEEDKIDSQLFLVSFLMMQMILLDRVCDKEESHQTLICCVILSSIKIMLINSWTELKKNTISINRHMVDHSEKGQDPQIS